MTMTQGTWFVAWQCHSHTRGMPRCDSRLFVLDHKEEIEDTFNDAKKQIAQRLGHNKFMITAFYRVDVDGITQ